MMPQWKPVAAASNYQSVASMGKTRPGRLFLSPTVGQNNLISHVLAGTAFYDWNSKFLV